jgi:carbon-monoxide dehydrogenase medium subunit
MDYFAPKSVSEALSLLARYGEQAKMIAGGTDIMVDIKYKEEPGCLVNIKRIPGIAGIRENGGSLLIGSLVTIRELETSALVRERLPLLWESCHQFASLQIRNTATIGGNICRASPSGETLAPLLALDAKARLAFSDGEKTEAFSSFFHGPGKTSLGSKGILTEIEIPYPANGSRGVYLKHAVRGAMDIAMVGVAVLVTPDAAKNNIHDARIGLGAVAPTPIRAAKTEALLRGKPVTAALLKEAAALAASESSPISDQRSSAEYRRWIVEALTRRGLQQTWKAATGKEAV